MISFFIWVDVSAQQSNIEFSNLSSKVYGSKIEYLEKYKVPKEYNEKGAQAWYDEILINRKDYLLDLFKDDKVLHDTFLLKLCDNIFQRIKKGNPEYNFNDIHFYINRSPVANAANFGEGTIMINLGLFLITDNEDEIALVIGHELAHQLLTHLDSKVRQTISTLTSDEFKKELKDIKRSEYNKFGRFKNLMKGISIESGKHSRYKETEADSLGVVFARNAGYDVIKAAPVLLKLDKVEDIYEGKQVYNLKSYFEGIEIQPNYFKPKTKYKGLSSVNVTMNADADFDSIKTHPDCRLRYEKITGSPTNLTPDCCNKISHQFKNYKDRALLESVRYLYERNNITLALHYCFMGLNSGFDPKIYQRFISLCFTKLYYADEKLSRFNYVNVGAKNESNLKELQDFLFEIHKKDLETIALFYLNKCNENNEDDAFVKLQYNLVIKKENPENAIAAFNNSFPNNKYQYLITKKSK